MWACMCPSRMHGCVRYVRIDPNVEQIWDTNGSSAYRLSVWIAEHFYLFFVRVDTFGHKVSV
jgi:hypothetical protein